MLDQNLKKKRRRDLASRGNQRQNNKYQTNEEPSLQPSDGDETNRKTSRTYKREQVNKEQSVVSFLIVFLVTSLLFLYILSGKFVLKFFLCILFNNLLMFAHYYRLDTKATDANKYKIQRLGLMRALGVANLTFVYRYACFYALFVIIEPSMDDANDLNASLRLLFSYGTDILIMVIFTISVVFLDNAKRAARTRKHKQTHNIFSHHRSFSCSP